VAATVSQTNTFTVKNAEGTPKTMFRPRGRAAMKNPFIALFFCLLLSACSGLSQTADEFRAKAPISPVLTVDTYKVDRAFKDVAATFQAMAPKCLYVRVRTQSTGYQSNSITVAKYTPTVLVSEKKAELHLQRHNEKGAIAVYKEPEKGFFVMVVDAIPIGAKRTKILVYRSKFVQKGLINAIKGWASGENVGCPDFSQ
jgi:hypothetical protein